MQNDNLKNNTPTDANNVLGEGLFCGLPCQNCKHKNSVTVGNGWNSTRCRLQPHKDFWQIKAEDDFVGCGFQSFTYTIDIAELIKLHDDFVFNKFKEEFKKIGIEIKSIDCIKELKEDLLQVDFDESINVFYKKEPFFIYPSFKMWFGK